MTKQSAGILLYRLTGNGIEVLLVHPGGPFFTKKDKGWWTIPKGEVLSGETMLEAAIRECEEETGYLPSGNFLALSSVVQKGGKQVHCWAVEGNLEPSEIISNTFPLEWPSGSGKTLDFPEVDQARWFSLREAECFINERQQTFLTELGKLLKANDTESRSI